MSTPSTATATVPPHHGYYGYSNHQAYQSNASLHTAQGSSLSGSSRLAPSQRDTEYTDDYYPEASLAPSRNAMKAKQPANTGTSDSTPAAHQSRRERRPDWHEFYKNGPPKEIIVIDDDSPPPHTKAEHNMPQYSSHSGLSNGGPSEHTNKKRKTGYDAVPVRHQASYSHTNTPHYAGSGSDTISTDRTTSLHTTAPTSLGSHSGGSGGAYVESGPVGQKRKRVTRQTTADEKKRKEIEDVGDAYSSYVPPPKPPIKAKEVFVQTVKDVSSSLEHQFLFANLWIVSAVFTES